MIAHREGSRSAGGRTARLALVDGDVSLHALVREQLRTSEPRWCLEAYQTGEEALKGMAAAPPRLALLEQILPDGCGIEWARQVRSRLPALPVVIIANKGCLRRLWVALGLGVKGYVVKTGKVRDLLPHLHTAMQGRITLCEQAERLLLKGFTGMEHAGERWGLTRREQEVMTGLCQHQTDKEISTALGVSPGTIHAHLAAIYKKLNVHHREAAVRRYYGDVLNRR